MAESDVCLVKCLHRDRVKKVEKSLRETDLFYDVSEFFKAMADPTRAKILYALSQEELCVCDVSHLLKMSESAVSHQLRVLRNTRLVKHRKEGRMVFYALDDSHVKALIEQGIEHVKEAKR